MEPLFEAKAAYQNQYALYNIYRAGQEKYRAQLIADKNGEYDADAPMELIISKSNGKWQTDFSQFSELGTTIGEEIDAFNSGYGDILGRIGVE